MKKIILLLSLLLLVTACAEEVPEIIPEPVPEPEPEPPIKIEPIPEPEPIPEVEVKEPPVQEVPTGRPTCKILIETGHIYTPEDVVKGVITLDEYHNTRLCYPYFSENQASTESMCCVI